MHAPGPTNCTNAAAKIHQADEGKANVEQEAKIKSKARNSNTQMRKPANTQPRKHAKPQDAFVQNEQLSSANNSATN